MTILSDSAFLAKMFTNGVGGAILGYVLELPADMTSSIAISTSLPLDCRKPLLSNTCQVALAIFTSLSGHYIKGTPLNKKKILVLICSVISMNHIIHQFFKHRCASRNLPPSQIGLN